MTKREQLDALCMDMLAHDVGDPKRIQHFLKVEAFAALIGRGERVDEHTQFIIEAVGYVHDIGIRIAEEKYGYQNGKLQQELGPDVARTILLQNGFSGEDTNRICWLIAHHHMYDAITDMDHQILIEADFLVNLYEDGLERTVAQKVYDRIFKTETGKSLFYKMFLSDRGFELSD